MSYGKMNKKIDIVSVSDGIDSAGFASHTRIILASVRAYKEGRHGTEVWANRATFSSATDLFRFRKIPNLEVTTDLIIVCNGEDFEITSVEDVKGKGMYIEVLGKKVSNG